MSTDKTHLSIEYVSIDTLKPSAQNARFHPKKQIDQIAMSIKQFGFVTPNLIDSEKNIIAGHGRLEAAKQLGLKEVPVIQIDHLSDAQITALMIADNKLTENAKWDKDLLTEQFRILNLSDLECEIDITGFSIGEIDMMLQSSTSISDVDESSELLSPSSEVAVSKLGDLWILGNHRIYCGNALNAECYAELMRGKKAQMVITDPPYNVPIQGHVSGLGKVKHREFAMATGEMSNQEFKDFLTTTFFRLIEVSIDGVIHFIFMDWRHMPEILAAAEKAGYELKNLCVWAKDSGGMGAFYRSQHELVFAFKHGKSAHINNFELGQHGRYRTNVWSYSGINSFARETEEGNLLELHPTVKPVPLVADAILDCSKPKGIVLDCFLGSGSTLIAAEKVGRHCYGMELDPLYVDVAIRRWQACTSKQAVHAHSQVPFDDLAGEVRNDG